MLSSCVSLTQSSHANYSIVTPTRYKLEATTSQGELSVPQLGGQLSLSPRDSKVHVTDYDVGGINLLYSSAEIFTWFVPHFDCSASMIALLTSA